MASSELQDPLEDPWACIALGSFVAAMLVHGYLGRFRRCPDCGEYALRKPGNVFINFAKDIISLGDNSYRNVCQNCKYTEWVEVDP